MSRHPPAVLWRRFIRVSSRETQRGTPCCVSSASGVTIAEVLVALVFMAVVTVGMTGLAMAIFQGNAKSRAMATAVYLAQDRLETIRNTPYANITSANFPAEGYDGIKIGPTPYPAHSPFPSFQRSVTIQDNIPIAGMKRIVVTVSWPSGSVREEMLVGQ